MNFQLDEDQDSLFGSPPPSPARGRSPSQETFVAARQARPTIAVPSPGPGRKNVGTIALPGSHMSCAELPADLPASSPPIPRPTSSHASSSVPPTSVHPPTLTSRSSTRSVPSRASSATASIPPASRKRKPPKSKPSTPISPAPPITLPGPDEPTPPNFLRSQSSLLGLAGLVGSVKPAQLYLHGPQPVPLPQSRSQSPARGSTPTHPIVLDDDRDTPRIGKQPYSQLQVPQHLDQLDPEALRSNIMSSLTKEKNIFPVLESLIKLLGGEPRLPTASLPSQPFARPYGHPVATSRASSDPPPKRRKLKHVPAGAVDWDVPFPFAAGEGPEAYRDTWARDRAKQLVTQLLELVQNATKRAAVKTAKSGRKTYEGRTSTRLSRSTSSETPIGKIDSSSIRPSLKTSANSEPTSIDGLQHYPDLWEISGTDSPALVSMDSMSVGSEGTVEEGGSAVSYDYSAFEEWLSQIQHFVPSDTNTPTPESDWVFHSSAPLDSSLSSQHPTTDVAIDPALLAISQQSASAPTSPTPTIVSDDVSQMLGIPPTPPAFAHSPRTESLSSLTEPCTPPSEAFGDVPSSTIAPLRDVAPVEKEARFPGQVVVLPLSPTASSESPHITAVEKGKSRADDAGVSASTPSMSRRPSPVVRATLKGVLDKQAILERARERRKQLVAELEKTKVEIWETTVENAVLVHFVRDLSSS